MEKVKNPKATAKNQPIVNYFIACLPFILFNLALLYFIALSFDDNKYLRIQELITWSEVFLAAASLFIIYSLKAFHLYKSQKAIALFEDTFLFKVTALFITNLLGMLVVYGFDVTNTLFVLTVLITARIVFEIYFSMNQAKANNVS
jgi:hypothetical protein